MKQPQKAAGVILAALALALGLTAAPASAAITTQIATADTFVNGDAPTGSFGTLTTMRVDDGFPKISYVKFAAAPSGTLVDAKLRVHGTGNDALAFKVYKVPSTWTESTTYNTRPTLGTQVGSGTFVASGYTQVDVDAGVTPGQVTSLAIVRDSAGADTILSTRETANEPELVVDVTSAPTNAAPSTSAGPDRAVTLPAGASLDGTVSDDGLPTGSTVTQTWTKVSGPGTVTFGNASAVDTTASFSVSGTYVLRLTATDGTLSSSDDVQVVVSPAPSNAAPTVNAGTDQTVTLPASASLNGTVTDPDSTPTTAWSKVSGAGTVTFGNSAAVDTTATFSTSGAYVLRLTANDGVNPAVTDDVQVTVNATPPPPVSEFDVLGLTEAQIDAIPTGTAAWTELVAMADDAYTVVTNDGAPDGSGNAVAGALVYVRTGNTAYKTKVENALAAAQAVAPASWDQAAANRHLGGWIAAAQLVGKSPFSSGTTLNSWGTWVNQHLTVTHAGGVPRNQVMIDTARGWDNNHGAAARQSVAAIEAYLNQPLTTSCNAMKAWLGGTHSGYAFVADTSPAAGQMGWTDNGGAPSWYVSTKYAGVNPSTAWAGTSVPAMKDGAIPSDVERDGGTYPTIGSAGSDHYVYGNLYREVAAMVTLSANGCSLWTYADSAIKRAQVWAQANVPDHQDDYLGNADPVLNAVFGLNTPADVGTGENFLAASEWLASSTWPVR